VIRAKIDLMVCECCEKPVLLRRKAPLATIRISAGDSDADLTPPHDLNEILVDG
jgi:hypothetical protein